MTNDQIEAIANADWRELYPRLLYFARLLALKAGCDPEELVQESVSLALGPTPSGGGRQWNRAQYGTLEAFLRSVIRSVASHRGASNLADRGRKTDFDETSTIPSAYKGQTIGLAPDAYEPDTALERSELGQQISAEINRCVKGDDEALLILMAIEDGSSKPREIADAAGLDVEIVYRILERMRRRLKPLWESVRYA